MTFSIPDAPDALRPILRALPKDGTGLLVHQHLYINCPLTV